MTWSTIIGYLLMETATALAVSSSIMIRKRLFPKTPFPGISWYYSITAPVLTAASPKVPSSAEASSTAQNPHFVHSQEVSLYLQAWVWCRETL